MKRKWTAIASALSFPAYLLMMTQITNPLLWLINFTNYAWAGFLGVALMLIGLWIVGIAAICNVINFWHMKQYLKDNDVTKLPWYLYWGLQKEVVDQKVSQQNSLLASEDIHLLPASKSEDISYTIRTWKQKSHEIR